MMSTGHSPSSSARTTATAQVFLLALLANWGSLVPLSAMCAPILKPEKSIIFSTFAQFALFLRKYSREFKKDVRGISRGALPALMAYDWPGNVRELENIIERSVALATRPVVRLDDLPVDLAIHEVGQRAGDVGSEPLPLREARDRFEQAYFLRALERENWNQSRAARCLGIHRNTLIARMAAWGIRRVEEAKDLPEAAAGEGT